ncbi:beta-N-acetylhexosaminidase [Heterostelium album PN500]|uniref:Beta-hexosaminidase n=1 Tax=Heterostelium pallidum (strain ATCC 26659 / Pp 5 / PN500) TaxID=670386 RepID=D3B3L7_HETP5|nr:beta-N-acetylhexosaminidase [Heterostelium album PN500]EFA83915.1 beta-N-acetylhexosaminidase [Heterostelium album PN500]|eukprot:XP_020436032.1 beta-N-acetylhexosaminidase [Heterostelium album PN500]
MAVLVGGQSPVSGPLIVPQPQQMTFGTQTLQLNPLKFQIYCPSKSPVLASAIKRYSDLFFLYGNGAPSTAPAAILNIKVISNSDSLYLGVSENHTISLVAAYSLLITADTVYGAIRALETVSQIIQYDFVTQRYTIPNTPISITDYPRFPWRGIMIDTARHFVPASYLMHTIDALAANKMNTLHWHITDGQSFPASSVTYPNLTMGAWAPEAVFSVDDIKEVVAYGKSLGVRVVPEFDIPSHTYSWAAAFPTIMANCPDYTYSYGQLPMSIANYLTYEVITNLFTEMSGYFLDTYFHTGGDEVPYGCWKEDPQVAEWMNLNGYTPTLAEQFFEDQVTSILAKVNRTKIVWNDPFVDGVKLDPSTLIQVWDSSFQDIVNAGFEVIVSFDYYLDEQVPTGNLHWMFEDTWSDFYAADPYNGITSNTNKILGGEACMWSEQVNHLSMDVRVWPRAIGVAERLWSAQTQTDVNNALTRIGPQTCRMSQRGIASGPLFPDFCMLPDDFESYLQQPRMRLSKEQINTFLNNN